MQVVGLKENENFLSFWFNQQNVCSMIKCIGSNCFYACIVTWDVYVSQSVEFNFPSIHYLICSCFIHICIQIVSSFAKQGEGILTDDKKRTKLSAFANTVHCR